MKNPRTVCSPKSIYFVVIKEKRQIEVSSVRDLGVNILADLSPEIHINGIVRAAYAFLSNIRVAFRHMDKEMFRNIYVTY
ncbi:hypothetical protein SK128_002347, partial [Halocaridina rubra]